MLEVQYHTVQPWAQPLARWLDKMLWRWSPWHLRESREMARRYRTKTLMVSIAIDDFKLELVENREAFVKHLDRDAANEIGQELLDKGYIQKTVRPYQYEMPYPHTVFEYRLHVPLAPPPSHR